MAIPVNAAAAAYSNAAKLLGQSQKPAIYQVAEAGQSGDFAKLSSCEAVPWNSPSDSTLAVWSNGMRVGEDHE